jgi:acetyl esterase/lipase
MKTFAVVIFITFMFFMPLASHAFIALDEPTPPDQPSSGPGGSDYTHDSVIENRYGWGAQQYWIFEPDDPMPESAPLIVFNHGWGAIRPTGYLLWIYHIVKKGNIVVYPRYELFLRGSEYFTRNAINAVKNAIQELQKGNHVQPDLDKFAIVGHSIGGGITAYMAALAQTEGLPTPKAIMPVQPAYNWTTNPDLSLIPNTTLMVVVVGASDTTVGMNPGISIFYEADKIPVDRKDFVIQVTDRYGSPDLIASHFAPVCMPGFFSFTVNAMDYYSTWKLFDALTDYAFYGLNREYCLGNTSEQRFMGLWSDGTPVKELIVTDTPFDVSPYKIQVNKNICNLYILERFPLLYLLLKKLTILQ